MKEAYAFVQFFVIFVDYGAYVSVSVGVF